MIEIRCDICEKVMTSFCGKKIFHLKKIKFSILPPYSALKFEIDMCWDCYKLIDNNQNFKQTFINAVKHESEEDI